MTATNGTATAWALKLTANGADPHLIAAWMRHELDADPLAFADLMTRDEITNVRIRQGVARVGVSITAITANFRQVAEAARRSANNLAALKETRHAH